VTTPGIQYDLLDGRAVDGLGGDLLAVRAEAFGKDVPGQAGAVERARLLRVWGRQPGFMLAVARHGGYLVGFAAGMPLRPSTSWWRKLTAPLPEADTDEYPGRTFALAQLAVRPAWRRQGVGRELHDLLLAERSEERATLTVAPDASAAQRAFRAWGWQKIARTKSDDLDPGVLDVLIIHLPFSPAHGAWD
jgi:ribosomal protein S18 acetylase RimI-like enzyme